MKEYLKINVEDNVAVAMTGEKRGHKFATRDIAAGEPVIKYGFPIGRATADIRQGEWVHSHNLATALGDNLQYQYNPVGAVLPTSEACSDLPVNGYLRANGDMGIRNELWIIPTVGCVNGQANAIAERLRRECDLAGIDDVRAFTHNYGCSQLGADHANTRAALAALASHPNVGGVLILGLGCENNQIDALRAEIESRHPLDDGRIKYLVAQEVEDEIAEGVKLCQELLERMKSDKRQPLPISKLKIGVKCGGSDGLSGITANPLVGRLTNALTSCGGTVVLTEVPEMFGAETILMNRACSREVFDKIVELINGFKDYFRSSGQPIYENPSPGNKAGGITTLEEKSLGCIQKGGTASVIDVLQYAQAATKPGLNLLQAPGNDLVAATALALSGCQMVLFTTGRGTPFGTCVPTLKIATNTPLSIKKSAWIDFNAGDIAEGASFETKLPQLLAKVVAVANGERAKHELLPAKEIAIFKTGVTL